MGDIPQSHREEVESRFVIGPVTSREAFGTRSGHPWRLIAALVSYRVSIYQYWAVLAVLTCLSTGKSPRDYLKAISQRELAWIGRYAAPKAPQHDLFAVTEAQNSSEAHIALDKKFLDVVDYLLPSNPELIRSTTWHWDIHAPNLFVDGDRVTSLN